MHHVKNDKRSQSSANAIYNGLLKLLETKTFDTITVSEICDTSNVSRATFYRNFDIIEDILAWYGNELVHKVIKEYFELSKNNTNLRFSTFALTYALQESKFIETLSKNNKMHILETIVLTVIHNLPINFDINESPYIKYAIYAKIGSFFSIVNCWIASGRKETIEDIENNLEVIANYIHTINIK